MRRRELQLRMLLIVSSNERQNIANCNNLESCEIIFRAFFLRDD